MDRRTMLGMLGAGAALGVTASVAVADDKAGEGNEGMDAKHKECLEACGECAKECDKAFHHCYTQLAAGKVEHARSLHLVSDCAGFCALSACLIAKHSPLMADSCEACAKACAATLAETSKFDSGPMQNLNQALKRCEASCKAMVAAMSGSRSEQKR